MQRGGNALTDTTENTIERFIANKLGNLGWSQGGVDAEEIRSETSNVGDAHRSSGDGFGLSIIPSGSDVHAGSPDIN